MIRARCLIDNTRGCCYSDNTMKAELLLEQRVPLSRRAFVEIVIWRLARAVRGSAHPFKYRLAYVANRRCVIRFDNEAGKGDHLHIDEREQPYRFRGLEALQADFWATVERRRKGR